MKIYNYGILLLTMRSTRILIWNDRSQKIISRGFDDEINFQYHEELGGGRVLQGNQMTIFIISIN